MKNVLLLILSAILCSNILVGCGDSESFVFNQTSGSAAAPDPDRPSTGNILIQLALQNNRSIKPEVQTFGVTLSQDDTTVFEQSYLRSDVGASQTIKIEGIAPGDYTLRIRYLDGRDNLLGEFLQSITVTAGDNALVIDPNYRNVIPDFIATRNIYVENETDQVEAVDLNGDGLLDLITVSPVGNVVSVLLARSDGTFQVAVHFPVGTTPESFQLIDVNSDEKLDVITANYGSDDLSILLGNGDGSFQPAQSLPAGDGPRSVAAGDANDDDIIDLVCVNAISNTISVFAGKGDGSFELQGTIPSAADPSKVLLADLDGDDRLDILYTSSSAESLDILFNDGGSFLRLNIAGRPNGMAVADLNGDEKLDIVVLANVANEHSIYLNNGDKTFQPPQKFAVGFQPTWITTADVNGDNYLDLLSANNASDDLSVLLGRGDGSFETALSVRAGIFPTSVTAADMNGDGRVDLVAGHRSRGHLTLVLGKGDGTFVNSTSLSGAAGGSWLEIADVNGDQILDLTTVELHLEGLFDFFTVLRVRLGKGDGSFQPALETRAGETEFNSSVKAADFNSDGKLDLVAADSDSFNPEARTTVSLRLGNGDGTFQGLTSIETGTNPSLVAVGDLNGDGRQDIVASAQKGDLSVLLGQGDGTFESPAIFPVGETPRTLKVLDINKDSKPDVVTVNSASRDLSVLIGNGDGTFQPTQSYPIPGFIPTSLGHGDINGDGHLDLITETAFGGGLFIFTGRGDGTFQEASKLEGLQGPPASKVALIDINGDSALDIVYTSGVNDSVSVVLGNGDGTFQTSRVISFNTGGSSPDLFEMADLNGDEMVDIVALHIFSEDISVLLAR